MIRRWKFEVGEACAYWLAMSAEYWHLSWVTKCQWHSMPNKDVARNLYLRGWFVVIFFLESPQQKL